MPNSVHCMSLSYIGQALNLTAQPFGSSLLIGMPAPPPVLSPTTVTLGQHFMYFTNSLAALNTSRLVSTTTCLCHRMPLDGFKVCFSGSEKSSCPGPVLCCM